MPNKAVELAQYQTIIGMASQQHPQKIYTLLDVLCKPDVADNLLYSDASPSCALGTKGMPGLPCT